MSSEALITSFCQYCSRRARCDCQNGTGPGVTVNRFGRYDSLIQYYATSNGLDWRLIKKQAIAESSLDPRAKSPKGAMGLMQILPSTWSEWGEGDPYDPEASIKAGCRYMAFLYGRFGEIPDTIERYKFAFASYNCGRSNINKVLQLARTLCGLPSSFSEWNAQGRKPGEWQTWRFASKLLATVTGQENSRETLGYVRKIMGG